MARYQPAGVYEETVVYEGITTSAGNVGGTTVIDSNLIQGTDYWKNMVVLILSGNSNKQARRISGFTAATDTLTVDTAFASQIASGTRFAILSQHTGNGVGDATAANQVLILADTNAILLDTAEIGAAGAGLTAVAQASVCTNIRLAELDAANLPADIDIIKADTPYLADSALPVSPTDGSLASFIATGGTALGTRLPASKSLYDVTVVDRLSGTEIEGTAAALNAYAGAATSTETGANVVTISTTTRKKLHFLGVQISGLTAGATATLRMYTKMLNADASLTKFYSESFTVGTDVPFVPIVNGTMSIRNDVRIEIQSNNASDISISAKYNYILESMEV